MFIGYGAIGSGEDTDADTDPPEGGDATVLETPWEFSYRKEGGLCRAGGHG